MGKECYGGRADRAFPVGLPFSRLGASTHGPSVALHSSLVALDKLCDSHEFMGLFLGTVRLESSDLPFKSPDPAQCSMKRPPMPVMELKM